MIFRKRENLKMNYLGKEFDSFDNNSTKDRKQLTILNYNLMSINVNSLEINLNKEIQNVPTPEKPFYQFSILNLQDNKIIVKANEINEQPDFEKLTKKKKTINEFYKEFSELIKKKTYNYEQEYYLVLNYYKNYIKSIGFNLNKSKADLDQYFKDNHIELDVIHKYMIFDIFSDGKRKYSKNKELLQKKLLME